jgi:hypothetical protein
MNDRFVELMTQAGFDSVAIERIGIMPNAERFAQLIVQDCIKLAEEFDGPKLSGPGMIIANRIQDRFGIGFCPCCGSPSGHLCDDSCIWS